MYPVLNIFQYEIPTYSVMGLVAVVASYLVIYKRCKLFNLNIEDATYIYTWGVMGAMIGAKLLYLVVAFPQVIKDLPILFVNAHAFLNKYISGGMVFYGGLIGAFVGSALSAHLFKQRLTTFYPALLPVVPLFSGIGRIGCFLAGCCYGCETSLPIGVIFPEESLAPAAKRLFPVQLVEFGFDLMLFAVILRLTKASTMCRYSAHIYCISYGIIRFFLEFFRGDIARGIICGISVSQLISIGLIVTCIVDLTRRRGAS